MRSNDHGLEAARRRMAVDSAAAQYNYLKIPMDEPADGGIWLGDAGRYEKQRRVCTAAANESEALGHSEFAAIHRAEAEEATSRRDEAQRAAIAAKRGAA